MVWFVGATELLSYRISTSLSSQPVPKYSQGVGTDFRASAKLYLARQSGGRMLWRTDGRQQPLFSGFSPGPGRYPATKVGPYLGHGATFSAAGGMLRAVRQHDLGGLSGVEVKAALKHE